MKLTSKPIFAAFSLIMRAMSIDCTPPAASEVRKSTVAPSIPAFFRWNFALSRSMSRCGMSSQK